MKIKIDGTKATTEALQAMYETMMSMTMLQKEALSPPTAMVTGGVEDVTMSWIYLDSSYDEDEDDYDTYVSARTTLGLEDLSGINKGQTVTVEGPLVDLYCYEMESGRKRFSITIAPADLSS